MSSYADLLDRIAPDDSRLLRERIVPEPPDGLRRGPETLPGKIARLARSFRDRPLIWLYHARLIVCLRRDIDVPIAWERFDALWLHHGPWLIDHLDSRWLVSACDTLADHHPDPGIRAASLAVSTAMNTLRLSETERRARGPDLRPMGRDGRAHPLHDGLRWFAIGSDDTVANLMARLQRIKADGTLPGRILAELIRRTQEGDTVFRRMADAHDLPATAWAARSAPRLRVALFNDTSTRNHYGCTAVSDTVNRLFGDAGIEIIWRHHVTTNCLDDPGTRPAIAAADAIVINGEGTMHHNARKARALAALGPMARAAGKPAWLINATLQGNDASIADDLRAFSHIWVREGASADWARANGLRVTIAPDLSLCQKLDRSEPGRADGGTLVIDSVVAETNLPLHRHARRLGGRLWTMEHDADGQLLALKAAPSLPRVKGKPPDRRQIGNRTFLPQAKGGRRDLAKFIEFLSPREALITGRFHAVCLAMLLRLPFHAYPSNTWKIEAMLADAGLNPARMLAPDAATPATLPFSDAELAAVDRYIGRARLEAGQMVLRILSGY